MNIVRAAVFLLVVVTIAETAMLLVRRRAPDGGYFADSDRAAGIFGVIATVFSVLLDLLVFLGFESYDSSRRAPRRRRRRRVAQQIQTAQLLPNERIRRKMEVIVDRAPSMIVFGRFRSRVPLVIGATMHHAVSQSAFLAVGRDRQHVLGDLHMRGVLHGGNRDR